MTCWTMPKPLGQSQLTLLISVKTMFRFLTHDKFPKLGKTFTRGIFPSCTAHGGESTGPMTTMKGLTCDGFSVDPSAVKTGLTVLAQQLKALCSPTTLQT